MKKRSVLWVLVALLGFLLALSRLDRGQEERSRQQLEEALRRTAVTCYAIEGFYPPSLAYMQTHYGLSYDEEAYAVHYEVFAANLMPEITVLERTQ